MYGNCYSWYFGGCLSLQILVGLVPLVMVLQGLLLKILFLWDYELDDFGSGLLINH